MLNKKIGIIIFTKLIKDNDLYIKIFSDNDDIISGIVYGGNSSKKRLIYQLGYFIEFYQKFKNNNAISSITGELTSPFIVSFFNDKFKAFSLLAIISILNKSLYEGQKINGLFFSLNNLINIIQENQHWLIDFCEWNFYLLKLIGYEIDYIGKNSFQYFNLNSLNFQNKYTDNNTIIFPHELFDGKRNITYESINSFFIIFETVFERNLLNHFNDKIPVSFRNFKELILNTLNKSS